MTSPSTNERTPLLRATSNDDVVSTTDCTEPSAWRFAAMIPYLLILIAFEISTALLGTPMSEIQEGIICQKHFADVRSPAVDPRCKSEIVQSELSFLQGWESTCGLIPGVLTTVPYGIAADRYGRKAILCICLLGIALSAAADMIICYFPEIFPLRLMWLSAMLTLVGGGPFVFSAMILTIASDISTQAQQSTLFFHLSAIMIAGQLISAPLMYAAMTRGAWFSMFVGYGCMLTALLIALATRETRVDKSTSKDNQDGSDEASVSSQVEQGLWQRVSAALQESAASIRGLFWENKQLGLLMSILIFIVMGGFASSLLPQYMSKRFALSWSEAGLLSSVTSGVNLVLVVIILPLASQLLLTKFELTPMRKDIWLVRASLIPLVVGTFGIGLADQPGLLIISLIINALGNGCGAATRSLLAMVVDNRHRGTLFTTLSFLENIAILGGGPLVAATFKIGIAWGGPWIGLPFILASIPLGCATMVAFGVQIQERGDSTNASDD